MQFYWKQETPSHFYACISLMCPVMQLWYSDAIIRYSQHKYKQTHTHKNAHTQPKNRNIIYVKSNIWTMYVRDSLYHSQFVVPKQQRPSNQVIIVTLKILCVLEFELDRICYRRWFIRYKENGQANERIIERCKGVIIYSYIYHYS